MSGAWQTIVALPAYNEEHSLPDLLEAFESLIQKNAALRIRIVVVNDGSKDNTLGILEEYKSRLPLEIVNHPQNMGLGQAIRTCLREAVARAQSDDDVIVCMDSDNTHLPEYIPALLENIQKGSDIVIASRYQPGSREVGVPALRRLYSRGARFLFWLFLRLPGVRDYTCGYRAYRAGLIKRALDIYGDGIITRNGFACTDDLLVRLASLTNKISEIPFILRYDKKIGESKLPLFITIKETLKLLIQKQERFPNDTPDNPAAPFFEGILLYDAGLFDEAINAFDESLKRCSLNSLVRHYRALAQFAAGHRSEALSFFAKSRTLENNIGFLARFCCLFEGEVHKLKSPPQPPLERTQSPAGSLCRAKRKTISKESFAALDSKDYAKVVELLYVLYDDNPKNIMNLYHLILALAELGRYEEAKERLLDFAERGAGEQNPLFISLMGWFYAYYLEDYERGISLLKSVPLEGPDDYGINYSLGVACRLANDRKASLEYFTRAFRYYYVDSLENLRLLIEKTSSLPTS